MQSKNFNFILFLNTQQIIIIFFRFNKLFLFYEKVAKISEKVIEIMINLIQIQKGIFY